MQELMQIARRHPESVAFVFTQYGYPALPVTGQSIMALYVKFGQSVLQDIAAQIANDTPTLEDWDNTSGPKAPAKPPLIKRILTTNRDGRRSTGATGATSTEDFWDSYQLKKPVGPALTSQNTQNAEKIKAINTVPILTDLSRFTPARITPTNTASTAKKPGIFEKVLGVLEKGVGIYTAVKTAPMEREIFNRELQQQNRRTGTTALIVGGLLIAILVAALLLSNKKTTIK